MPPPSLPERRSSSGSPLLNLSNYFEMPPHPSPVLDVVCDSAAVLHGPAG